MIFILSLKYCSLVKKTPMYIENSLLLLLRIRCTNITNYRYNFARAEFYYSCLMFILSVWYQRCTFRNPILFWIFLLFLFVLVLCSCTCIIRYFRHYTNWWFFFHRFIYTLFIYKDLIGWDRIKLIC